MIDIHIGQTNKYTVPSIESHQNMTKYEIRSIESYIFDRRQ